MPFFLFRFYNGHDLEGDPISPGALAAAIVVPTLAALALATGGVLFYLRARRRQRQRDAKLAVLRQLLAWERELSGATGGSAAPAAGGTETDAMADRIYVLEQGEVIEQGTHATLLAHGGKYAELCRKSFLATENSGAGG